MENAKSEIFVQDTLKIANMIKKDASQDQIVIICTMNESQITINVEHCGEESESEKLLGLLINNSCTWKSHLYGDADNLGLIKELSQRVGILRRLKNFLPSFKFNQIVNDIYYSKQMYGLMVYGSIWGLPGSMDEENRNSIMLTKEDMRKMQVMQNSVMRLTTNSRYDTPTSELLTKTNQLSIHQLMAFHISSQVYNHLEEAPSSTRAPEY